MSTLTSARLLAPSPTAPRAGWGRGSGEPWGAESCPDGRAQGAGVGAAGSSWGPGARRVPRAQRWVRSLFHLFISDLDEGTVSPRHVCW